MLKVGVAVKKTLTKSTKTYSTLTSYPLKIHRKDTSGPFYGTGCPCGPSGSLSEKGPATSAKSSSPMVEPVALRQRKALCEFFKGDFPASTPIPTSGGILDFFNADRVLASTNCERFIIFSHYCPKSVF